jgi:hypothetical protein
MGRLGTARLALLALAAMACTSCSYARSRAADFQDIFPWSIACGWGIGASLHATPLFHVGVGATPIVSHRYGYDDRIVNGVWHESETLFPYTLWSDAFAADPLAPEETGFPWHAVPIVYRWQVFRDAVSGEAESTEKTSEPNHEMWGRHPSIVRESLGAFMAPQSRRWLDFEDLRRTQDDRDVINVLGAPSRATLWGSRRAGRPAPLAWDLFEADIFLGMLGVRLGVRPVEAVDFLLGFALIDILGDDLPEPVSNEPREMPLPADA